MLLNGSGMLMDDWSDLAKVMTPAGAALAVGILWKGTKGIWRMSSEVTKIMEGMEHQAEKLTELADAFDRKVVNDERKFEQIEKRLRAVEQRPD